MQVQRFICYSKILRWLGRYHTCTYWKEKLALVYHFWCERSFAVKKVILLFSSYPVRSTCNYRSFPPTPESGAGDRTVLCYAGLGVDHRLVFQRLAGGGVGKCQGGCDLSEVVSQLISTAVVELERRYG